MFTTSSRQALRLGVTERQRNNRRRLIRARALLGGEASGDGDHQEYVESGVREILLIGGAAALLIGGFVVSLI
jgi:hypothetical protein